MRPAAGANMLEAKGEIKVVRLTRPNKTHFRPEGKFIGFLGSLGLGLGADKQFELRVSTVYSASTSLIRKLSRITEIIELPMHFIFELYIMTQ